MAANPILLHQHPEFKDLLSIVADKEKVHPVLVEKDYWIMQVLWGLQQQGLVFQLKGGTSLSKAFKYIDRFSEDVDILIEPPANITFNVNTTSNKPNAVQSRQQFYDWLAATISIDGIVKVTRDKDYDDTAYYRSGGIRLHYNTYFGNLKGVKDGILLEAGFSNVMPNEPITITSWAYDFGRSTPNLALTDNRAINVPCYDPGYTFVEKAQTIIKNFRQEMATGIKRRNFIRQYYDLYCLLKQPRIQQFITTAAYQAHKDSWIRGKDAEQPVNSHPAFLLEDSALKADFESRYANTSDLYYRGQVPFDQIINKIQQYLSLL